MKKVFISVPRKGRSSEDIEKSIKILKAFTSAYEDDELEFIVPVYKDDKELYNLGKSIVLLQDTDVFVGVRQDADYTDCYIQSITAYKYSIKKYTFSLYDVCPDLRTHNNKVN